MALRKTDKANIRQRYPLYVQVGLILALLLLIGAFNFNVGSGEEMAFEQPEQEIVQMEEIQQTQQIEKPPPPPKPPVPVEVPDDEVLEDEELDLDVSLDIDEPLTDLPPPPPPAEEEEEKEPEIFMIVEEMPEMVPSTEEGMKKLQGCIKYPEIAKKAGVEGRVFVQFVVDEQGNVNSPVVQRGIGAGADEEALRCVQQVQFKPGKQRGKAVRVKMSLPVTFKLK